MLDPNIFSKYKTKADFDREAEEFEFRKRQRAMQEQMQQMQMEQTKRQAMQPQMPMSGTGFEAQLVNRAYQANLANGMDPATAEKNAINAVLQSQQSIDPRGNVVTRRPIFDMSPREVMNMPVQQPQQATQMTMPPLQPNDPMLQQHAEAVAAQQAQTGVSPMQREGFAPPQLPNVTVDPSNFGVTSPYAREDIFKKAAEADIELQKSQKLDELKIANQKRAIDATNRIYQEVGIDDIDLALRILKDNPNAAGTFAAGGALIKESPAGMLNSILQTIGGSVGLDRLNKMRQSSPSGASGLGQLNKNEMDLLLASLGEMKNTTDPNLLSRNLMRYRNQLMDTVHGTPEHIQGLVDKGELSPEVGQKLSQRYDISGIGRPLSKNEKNELEMLRKKYGRK